MCPHSIITTTLTIQYRNVINVFRSPWRCERARTNTRRRTRPRDLHDDDDDDDDDVRVRIGRPRAATAIGQFAVAYYITIIIIAVQHKHTREQCERIARILRIILCHPSGDPRRSEDDW